ncbi:MAG: hypothetical protein JWM99_3646, partial [Verrucomicrobiales bacterium]|nr:hypothetical protein [Verrucomicrobiales bacterium]
RELLDRNMAIYIQKTGKLQDILDEVVRICPP